MISANTKDEEFEKCILRGVQEAKIKTKEKENYWRLYPETRPPVQIPTQPKGQTHLIPASDFIESNKICTVSLHFWGTKYDPKPTVPSVKEIGLHYHDFYEINYVYRGCVSNYLQDQIVQQSPHQLILMSPYACHAPEVNTRDTILFNILLRKDARLIQENPNLRMKKFHPYFLIENNDELNLLVKQIIQEYYLNHEYSQEMIQAKLLELWISIARMEDSSTDYIARKTNENFLLTEKILHYIHQNYSHVTLAETADKFGISPGHLSSLILKSTHKNFNDILRHEKMQNAARYLVHSDFNMDEIAELIGYNDASYFRKVFKKNFGISPKEYRRTKRTFNTHD